MKLAGMVLLAALLLVGQIAGAAMLNFDFHFSYQTLSVSGRLIGLTVDANGNGTNLDPTEVLLYSVPPTAGILASPSNPYVFIP